MDVYYSGHIDGDFNGFDEGNIFKLDNGTFWIQSEYHYGYSFAYNPEATILDDYGTYYLLVNGEKARVEQLDDVIESRIDGDFDGFDEGNVYKLDNGTFWIQSEHEHEHMHEYNPNATVLEHDGKHYLLISGKKVEVEQLDDVIESRIDGDFEGWDEDKAYKLENGEVWQQSSYNYDYAYAYCPDVLIYSHNGTTYMQVEGTKTEVKKLISADSGYSAGSYNSTSSYSGYSSGSYGSTNPYSGYKTGGYDSTIPFSDVLIDLENEYVENQPKKSEIKPTETPPKETKKSGGCLGLIVATLFLTFAICGILSLFSGNSKNTTKNNEHPNEVQIPNSADYYKDQNYYDVTIELMKLGLSNIQLSPMNDKKSGFLSSAGQIETIKINDYYDFNSGIWVNKNSPVSISYHSIEKSLRQEYDNEKNNHLILNRVDVSLPTYLVEEGKDSTSAIYHAKGDEETQLTVLINNNESWDVLSQYESYVILKREDYSVEAGSGSSLIALAKKNYKVYSVRIVSIWSEIKEQYIHFALVSEDSCKYDYTSDFQSIISGLFFPQDSDIRVDFTPDEYKGKNYEEVLATLQGKGFKNIRTENLEDVILGIFTKEGTVASITIDGKNDYKPGVWISDQSEIVISYHGKK